MERLTNKDRVLLDIAYETIKKKDLEKLMNEADTECAKRIIAGQRIFSVGKTMGTKQ